MGGPPRLKESTYVKPPAPEICFVYGSNLAGRNGAGAALYAAEHFGARRGIGSGPSGDAYGIPTKDSNLRVLPLEMIRQHVHLFKLYAFINKSGRPHLSFFVTRVGCGLAGYNDAQIGPFFKDCPPNCILPQEWKPYVGEHHTSYHDGTPPLTSSSSGK